MFVICDSNDRPMDQRERWRNLMPFFEHGNIADEQTLVTLKKQLATKALSSIASVLDEIPDIKLRYACAIDDSMCGSSLKCPPRPGQSMRELLEETLKGDCFRSHESLSRLVISPQVWVNGDYSSCHLPDILSDYFRAIEARAS
jgi:hypothetical protein